MKFVAIACLAAMPVFAQTTRTTTTTTTTRTTRRAGNESRVRVYNDATRLSAILNDVQNTRMRYGADTWRVSVNEANQLANRLYANTGGREQARELRRHVRLMRESALKGDAEGARSHAAEAAQFAYQLEDWASPRDSSRR